MGYPQNILNVARLQRRKSVRYPKQFDVVHQTVSPRERVGSGDETSIAYQAFHLNSSHPEGLGPTKVDSAI